MSSKRGNFSTSAIMVLSLGAWLGFTISLAQPAVAQEAAPDAVPTVASSSGAPSSPADSSAGGKDSAQRNSALGALGSSLSSPELPPSLIATPHRLDLMRQYMQAANMPVIDTTMAVMSYKQTRASFVTGMKGLPVSYQAAALGAFDKAYAAADARRQEKLLDAMAEYYATRMNDEELATVVSFSSSPLGQKMLLDAQHLTADERQQLGRYTLENPAMRKFTKLNFDYIKHAAASHSADMALFQADFRASFCHNLVGMRGPTPACPATHN